MPRSLTFQRTAMSAAVGTASFSSCIRLALSCTDSSVSPVTLPPGRARLAINSVATASPAAGAMTIGMLEVACFTASVAGPPCVTITSTLSWTISVASPGVRSITPSAKRASYAMFRPST